MIGYTDKAILFCTVYPRMNGWKSNALLLYILLLAAIETRGTLISVILSAVIIVREMSCTLQAHSNYINEPEKLML